MAVNNMQYEGKLLLETERGLMLEDGRRLFGSFGWRCNELLDEGWVVAAMGPHWTTFSRRKPVRPSRPPHQRRVEV